MCKQAKSALYKPFLIEADRYLSLFKSAWRMEPAWVKINWRESILKREKSSRCHTFHMTTSQFIETAWVNVSLNWIGIREVYNSTVICSGEGRFQEYPGLESSWKSTWEASMSQVSTPLSSLILVPLKVIPGNRCVIFHKSKTDLV